MKSRLSPSDLRAQLKIDKNALDEEVMRQPQLFSDIGEYEVEAQAELDAAKEYLETVDAKLDIKYRQQYKDEKTTEKMFANLVKVDPDHEKAFNEWLDAKTKAAELGNLQKSFLQRANMLKALGQLYSSNYWMEASIKPSKTVEDSHYLANRTRIANARAARSS